MFNCKRFKSFFRYQIKSHFLGFLFSIILTLIPFSIAMQAYFSKSMNFVIILICAILQIFVHFFYFLHLNFSERNKWNVISLLFILIIVFIIIFGSIWIMHNLNHHMIIHSI